MSDIKRVLWIDDVAKNRASNLFPKEETNIMTSMDEAIEEISGSHLYDYDTIVLDIDFENGIHESSKVMDQLSDQLYLSDDQKNNKFLITNGGYLLYLFLLKRGYPSDRIAFLTGNPAIVEQLRAYTRQNAPQLSKKQIEKIFCNLWNRYSDDIETFEQEIDKLPIGINYKQSDFLINCEEALDEDDVEYLSQLISAVVEEKRIGEIENTGDMMIFRFHQANLEAPAYFSKQDHDITGHNKADAEKWLNSLRTTDQVVRWLLMSVSNRVEQLFSERPPVVIGNCNQVYKTPDLGMRSAYKQLYCVLDGLRSGVHKEVYFQALSALLVPYEAYPKNISDKNSSDVQVRHLSAWCAKIARNLLAHNRFGTIISSKTALFVVMIAVSVLLSKSQREGFSDWYKKCVEVLDSLIIAAEYSISENDKIKNILEKLFANNEIEVANGKARQYTTYEEYDFRSTMYALTNNTAVDASGMSSQEKEDYYLFSLAAGYVRWFLGKSRDHIEKEYGLQVNEIYRIAAMIVKAYQYPLISSFLGSASSNSEKK